MFKSYFTSAMRDIIAHKSYSAINIIGLAVGLAACLLITIFVRDELGYDAFIPAAERTYRLDVTMKSPGQPDRTGAHYMGAYGPMLMERSVDVEETTRYDHKRRTVQVGDKLYYESIVFSDPNFLTFMGFDVPEGILDDQQAIVLTQSIAQKYFEDGNAVGGIMTISGEYDYRVAAVIPDMPDKSHLVIDLIAPYHLTRHADINTEYTSGNNVTYVRMKEGRPPEPLAALIKQLIDENVEQGDRDAPFSEFRDTTFVPVQDIYLKSEGGVVGKPSGDISVVYGFAAVAVLILVIATVNYINLATARALKRAREVGVRKVMGARRPQLVAQFLGESIIITAIALVLAVALAEIALPFFNDFLGREMSINLLGEPVILAILSGVTIIVGVVAGLYPALYLSAFKPVKVLKSEFTRSGSMSLRQALVFVQFAIAIALIAGTTVIVRQTVFATSMDPGYEKEGVLLLRSLRQNDLIDQIAVINQELANLEGVSSVTASQFVPTDFGDWTTDMHFAGQPDQGFVMSIFSHEKNFLDLYEIRTVAGRKLDPQRGADIIRELPSEDGETVATNILLNEAAVRLLGFSNPEAALGQQIVWPWPRQREFQMTVVGVVQDFHVLSVRDQIRPYLFFDSPDFYNTISVRFATNDFSAFLNRLERRWVQLTNGIPLDYQILEDRLDNFYSAENQQMKVFVTFAALALMVSAVGLFGLAAFSAERRTKEIGIRKVMGAGTADIVRLMVGQFSKPVILANLVALPIAWWLMEDWLTNFVYRVDLDVMWFASAGLAALAVAWITVSAQSLKAARANPIHSLRYE